MFRLPAALLIALALAGRAGAQALERPPLPQLLQQAGATTSRGAPDLSFVKSLMQRVTEPGKMAAWIAPPDRGINAQAVDYEYVKL